MEIYRAKARACNSCTYAAEFSRFNIFALLLVAKERDRARRFQKGRNLNIQEHMAITIWGLLQKCVRQLGVRNTSLGGGRRDGDA